MSKASAKDSKPMDRLRRAILSAASLLQDVPVGSLPDEDTLDLIDTDVRSALSSLEDIQDAMPKDDD